MILQVMAWQQVAPEVLQRSQQLIQLLPLLSLPLL
jgi:hypothetical protein